MTKDLVTKLGEGASNVKTVQASGRRPQAKGLYSTFEALAERYRKHHLN